MLPTVGDNIMIIGDSKMLLSSLEQVVINGKFAKQKEYIYSVLQYHNTVEYKHHYREKNQTADSLANYAMDKKQYKIIEEIERKKLEKKLKNDIEGELGEVMLEWGDLECITALPEDWECITALPNH